MRNNSISNPFPPSSLTHWLTNATLRMSRHREPISTVLYASSILALPSILTSTPFSPHLLVPPQPSSLPPQPSKLKDTSFFSTAV